MKIWAEEDMEYVIKMIDDEIRHPYRIGGRTEWTDTIWREG